MDKGALVAKNVSRRMSPVTGKDTDYIYEWRVYSEPGTQYPYSVHRIFTKDGKQEADDVMSVGQSPNEAIRDLYNHSVETVLNQAEKFGFFKSLYTREEGKRSRDAEKKRLAEERQVKEDAENSKRFGEVFSHLRTMKGIKESDIQIDVVLDKDFNRGKRTVRGFNVGNGVGVAISGEGKYRGYAVTHLNTGLAMGSEFHKRDDAIALARAVARVADWSKWRSEKDIPKRYMDTAAALVRAMRSGLLDAKTGKALESGSTIRVKPEVKLVSPAEHLQWDEPKAKLEKIIEQFKPYYGKKVTILGGGGAPPSTAVLQRIELHPTILKGKDGYTMKAFVTSANSKILPADKGGNWDFWLGSWQIAVNPKLKGKPAKSESVVKATKPVPLDWGSIHKQSREEILLGAGMQLKLADKKWSELEPWIQDLLKDSLKGRSKGKAKLENKSNSPQSVHDSRSEMSRLSDERQSNQDTIEPDDPRVDVWKRRPGSMDVRGVDTPSKKRKPKTKAKHSSSVSGMKSVR